MFKLTGKLIVDGKQVATFEQKFDNYKDMLTKQQELLASGWKMSYDYDGTGVST